MEIILIGFVISLVVSAGALTYTLVKAERSFKGDSICILLVEG
jgi:hypothetical protein